MRIIIFIVILIITVGISFIIWIESVRFSEVKETTLQSEKQVKDLKTIRYSEISPDRAKNISIYKLSFNKDLFDDYDQYFESQNLIGLEDVETGDRRYLFIGEERTGDPHWLGNDHIFFTTKCGTDCQGLYLLDTRDKESRLGVLSYVFENGFWETVFKSWFNKEFRFPGLVKDIVSQLDKNTFYLVFRMEDSTGKDLKEKKFLFNGDSLIEQ